MSQIILNRIQTPDGTILTSRHVHDYATHTDKNGEEYMVGGGFHYLRRNKNIESFKELSLDSSQPFKVIREKLEWGVNYDKDMVRLPSILWKPICDLGNGHIQSILDKGYGSEWIRDYFKQELEYRNK
jgi:hypothetical protein